MCSVVPLMCSVWEMQSIEMAKRLWAARAWGEMEVTSGWRISGPESGSGGPVL